MPCPLPQFLPSYDARAHHYYAFHAPLSAYLGAVYVKSRTASSASAAAAPPPSRCASISSRSAAEAWLGLG